MHFANASDYSGSHLQQTIVEALGHTVEELGSSNAPTVDYPGPARTIAAAIFTERAERAVPTGQAYKGGPNTGVFLQITCDDAEDLPVPGQKYTFGVVKAAQARGDFAVLAERGRRALRAHLGEDLKTGLATLKAAVQQALG